ncbi:major facilitator superfamily domain-containing protein [Cyathus striatus]|nr:major facilitator superfamily domain-containing protein [Cyathus striatus]
MSAEGNLESISKEIPSFNHVQGTNESDNHAYNASATPTITKEEDESHPDKEKTIVQPVSVDDAWLSSPVNPRNWPRSRKWVSMYTFVPPLGSSMMSPALPEVARKYGITSPTLLALTLSIFLLSFAIGPLFIAPLSEMYGRTWVYHIANVIFLAFNLGCAFSPTAGSLIAFRFLSGFAGAAPIAIGGGSVSDLFSERERAGAMAAFTIGPLIGGFIAETIGVKYVFIVISGTCAFAGLIGIPFLRETYAPVLRLRQPIVVADYRSKLRYLWLNLIRPAYMLTHSLICFILSLYMGLMYAIYYLMFTIFPSLFADTYGFTTGEAGLAYIGLGIGFIVATIISGRMSDYIYVTMADRNGGKGTPEMRIPSLIFGSFFVPIGLFWYGWSAQAKIHWIMPIIGTSIFGFGFMTTTLPMQLYLVDVFAYAASALSAASVARSLLGFAFPLFGEQMFAKLGTGGGNSLLAGLAIVIGIPFPIWLWFNGERIRSRSTLFRS